MKFRDNAHALGSARDIEIETIKLINFILVKLGEPVLRDRESIFVFELHIRLSEGKPDKSLGDFGNAIRRGMFYRWRISKRERLIRNRIHVSALNCILMRAQTVASRDSVVASDILWRAVKSSKNRFTLRSGGTARI
ncbi:MAG: hypothetical protein DME99_00850 [Verrucomicrobia bacterium]|nr:MAG: hypothetical protein DME99_00850 [Verrucomicrobiota bacterium]